MCTFGLCILPHACAVSTDPLIRRARETLPTSPPLGRWNADRLADSSKADGEPDGEEKFRFKEIPIKSNRAGTV